MTIAKLLLMGVVATMLAAGCQSYKDGKSRTVGEFTDDAAIQTRVKMRLTRAKDVNGLRMNIEVKKGVVTLHGRTDSPAMRQKAVEIAKSVKGVTSVEDRLRVKTKDFGRGSGSRVKTQGKPMSGKIVPWKPAP